MEIGVSTLGKIELNKSPEEGYNLTKAVLDTLGLKIKEKDDEKFFLKSKTKMSWMQNRYGIDFRILVRPAGNFCVIEIYSNVTSDVISYDDPTITLPGDSDNMNDLLTQNKFAGQSSSSSGSSQSNDEDDDDYMKKKKKISGVDPPEDV